MVIRIAVRKDLDQLAGLWMELMESHQHLHPLFGLAPGARRKAHQELDYRMRDPYTRIFVADAGRGELAGMIITRYYGNASYNRLWRCGYIAETIVRRGDRGCGIGTRLAETACNWLKAIGLDYIELQVVPENETALRFWENRGFAEFTRQMAVLL